MNKKKKEGRDAKEQEIENLRKEVADLVTLVTSIREVVEKVRDSHCWHS